ncbi:AMP-binding protein [Corallococcus sp. bb12-1]|uniref:AMP-binding protein n=1 Tax=Corallococcus sp. bb12-1 TaxID=2996784 RepID=UPI003B631C3B
MLYGRPAGGGAVLRQPLAAGLPAACWPTRASPSSTRRPPPSGSCSTPSSSKAKPRPWQLRYVIFGGEALDLASLRPWFERHGDARPQLVNMYGITETTVHVTWRPGGARGPGASRVQRHRPAHCRPPAVPAGRRRDSRCPSGCRAKSTVGGAGVARGLPAPARSSRQRASWTTASAPCQAASCTARETWRGGCPLANWSTWAASTTR